ncbi:MAG: glycosyltransferase family 4 protein [Ktedonobacterales bacterium]
MNTQDTRMLRVALNAQLVSFSQTYRNAGVSRFTYVLLESLMHDDHDQRYIAFIGQREAAAAAASSLHDSERIQLVPAVWPTERPLQRIFWEQTVLPAELRRLGVDVFHSPVNVLPEYVPCASVVTVHDLAFMRYPQYFRPARRNYQRVFTARSVRRATLTVAVSESTKRDLIDYFHVPEDRVRVIYNAIDPIFRPVDDLNVLAEFRARHALPQRYLLYLGTLEPRKNLVGLVEAYARLRSQDAETPPLVLAGAKGWYYQPLFERINSLGMQQHITFAGYISREEQPLWYAGAELFVYPSLYEGFGLPVAEALACGTPTITSNVSSMPEAGGAIAMLVDPNDWDALAHTMRVALADPSARARALDEGPRWAGRFSSSHMAAAYANVYREAAERARAEPGKRGK